MNRVALLCWNMSRCSGGLQTVQSWSDCSLRSCAGAVWSGCTLFAKARIIIIMVILHQSLFPSLLLAIWRCPAHLPLCLLQQMHNLKWATSWENLFMPYTNNKGADQPAHPHSLFSAFVVCFLDIIIPLFSKSNISRLASFCSWTGSFESYLVTNPEDRFSHDVAQMISILDILLSK